MLVRTVAVQISNAGLGLPDTPYKPRPNNIVGVLVCYHAFLKLHCEDLQEWCSATQATLCEIACWKTKTMAIN